MCQHAPTTKATIRETVKSNNITIWDKADGVTLCLPGKASAELKACGTGFDVTMTVWFEPTQSEWDADIADPWKPFWSGAEKCFSCIADRLISAA